MNECLDGETSKSAQHPFAALPVCSVPNAAEHLMRGLSLTRPRRWIRASVKTNLASEMGNDWLERHTESFEYQS